MPFDLTPRPPRTVDGYLELVARVILASGMSWQAIESRWPAIREAFGGFSVRKVAGYSTEDVAAALAKPGMINNVDKADAIVASAGTLAELRDRHGSIGKWLDTLGDFDDQQQALRRLRYVGPFGAYYVLSVAGRSVPAYDDWSDRYRTA